MKLAVVGSRKFDDYALLCRTLDRLPIDCIVSGGAIGADRLAARYARERSIEVIEFIPDWSAGRYAGMMRNKFIVDNCDALIAFWDGESKGTRHSIELARRTRKLYSVVLYQSLTLNLFEE